MAFNLYHRNSQIGSVLGVSDGVQVLLRDHGGGVEKGGVKGGAFIVLPDSAVEVGGAWEVFDQQGNYVDRIFSDGSLFLRK